MRYTNEVLVSAIPDFPNYSITSEGEVINNHTGRVMILTPTLHGDLTVGLMRDRKQHRRSVKVLVAETFVPRPDHDEELFDTPVLLDGNRENLKASNLVWRPRWFAVRYIRQFTEPIPSWYYLGPIYDTVNGMQYRHILEAAMTNGNLCADIHNSVLHGRWVFPGGEKYEYM